MADPTDDRTRHAPSRPPGSAPGADAAATGTWAGAVPARVGRYEVRGVLGEGASGRVYHGYDAELGREVAVKVPHPVGLTPAARERFLREGRAAARVHHPNVRPIYDTGTADGVPFIVMQYLPGGTLAGLLDRRTFSAREAAGAVRQVALGVAAAHAKGIVHRDLKPGNVLWDEAARRLVVTDFGLARLGGETPLTARGDVLGTPAYMAPEQARGDTDAVGPAADVYALGVILYRLLAGRVPYTGSVPEVIRRVIEANPPRPTAVNPAADPALEAICLRAMAADPAARFPSAAALADALADYLRTRHGSAADTPLPAPPPRRAGRRVAGVVLTALLVGGGAVGGFQFFGNPPPAVQEPSPPPPVEPDPPDPAAALPTGKALPTAKALPTRKATTRLPTKKAPTPAPPKLAPPPAGWSDYTAADRTFQAYFPGATTVAAGTTARTRPTGGAAYPRGYYTATGPGANVIVRVLRFPPDLPAADRDRLLEAEAAAYPPKGTAPTAPVAVDWLGVKGLESERTTAGGGFRAVTRRAVVGGVGYVATFRFPDGPRPPTAAAFFDSFRVPPR